MMNIIQSDNESIIISLFRIIALLNKHVFGVHSPFEVKSGFCHRKA